MTDSVRRRRLMSAGYQPLFSDHKTNPGLIDQALDDVAGYWTAVEEIRYLKPDSETQR